MPRIPYTKTDLSDTILEEKLSAFLAESGDGRFPLKVKNKNMFNISFGNFKSAIVYGFLTAIVAIGVYVIGVGDIFSIDSHALINAGVFGFLNVFISLLKNFLTTDDGKFLGMVKTY